MQLKEEDAFSSCSGYVSDATFNELCLMSVCQCQTEYTSCICSALTQFSRLCVARGAKVDNWRTEEYCGEWGHRMLFTYCMSFWNCKQLDSRFLQYIIIIVELLGPVHNVLTN